MDIEQFRKAGYQAIDRICDYYYTIQDRSVISKVKPGFLRKALPDSAPETGEDFQVIADDYQRLILPGLTHWQHPSFFAYFPTACTFEGILGDLYSSAVSNPGFNWSVSPACTELEVAVMDWAARLLGLSPAFYNQSDVGGGVMQSTASDSALVAVVAARSLYLRRNPEANSADLVIYTTTQTHSLGAKAGLVLGLSSRAIDVFSDDNFGLRGEGLRKALNEDLANGRKPFVLIATLGTTSSGAIDFMDEIGQVVQDFPNIWIHVDGAWAGVALACPEYRGIAQLNAINKYADSFCTNFHKWGLTNFDASALWVRDRKHLTEALDITPPFLRTKEGDAGTAIEYRNWHLTLGRRFRSLKLWFVLRSFGVAGFQEYIRRTIRLNELFASLVRTSSQFSLVAPPSFAVTVFRLVPPTKVGEVPPSGDDLNRLNRTFHECISGRDDILLTQTELNGVFCIRFAVGVVRTEEKHVQRAFEILCDEAQAAIAIVQGGQYGHNLRVRGKL